MPESDQAPDEAGPRADEPGGLVGSVISGRYVVERLLGTGGMGAVYQAEHMHMHKRLALKVLHAEMSRLPEVVARFEREAMAAAHIDHPNVAAATDFGKLDDGSFFLVLEYVEGRSLRDAIAEGRLDVGRACHVARQMASALGRAHALGIVHRDLKPENVMLVVRDTDEDFVKVLDFGIAKVPIGAFTHGSSEGGVVLTQLGMVYGTPEYMAPEQALGQEIDARADLYALGVILFEMVTGKRPFEHASKVTLLGMHVTAPIPRMRERAPEADPPEELDALVTRLLAKESGARFRDARELVDALDELTARLVGEGRIADDALPDALRGGPRTSRSSKSASSPDSVLALGPTSLAQPVASSPGVLSARGLVPAGVAAAVRQSLSRVLRSARAWAAPRLVVVASAGAAILLALAILISSSAREGRPRSAKALVSAALTHVSAPKMDDRVAEASAKIDRGDCSGAIEELLPLERADGDRADVHKLLERAYLATHAVRDALREADLWLASDEAAAADPKLQEDVRNAALPRDNQDDAFALLEAKMGARGIDLLYDIAYGASGRQYPQAAARARHSLDVEDVHSRASPALAVLLDMRAAKTCDAKHGLLDRVRTNGDARALALLHPLQATRGCGFLSYADCYPCLRKDTALKDAIDALSDRASPP